MDRADDAKDGSARAATAGGERLRAADRRRADSPPPRRPHLHHLPPRPAISRIAQEMGRSRSTAAGSRHLPSGQETPTPPVGTPDSGARPAPAVIASDGARPSLLKMLPTCFSMARSERNPKPAIAPLERPSAIQGPASPSSRGVREPSPCATAGPSSLRDDLWVESRAPARIPGQRR